MNGSAVSEDGVVQPQVWVRRELGGIKEEEELGFEWGWLILGAFVGAAALETVGAVLAEADLEQ